MKKVNCSVQAVMNKCDICCSGMFLKGDDKMPWYMNPVKTRKVLNRIANRYKRTSLQDLRAVLDHATQLIWIKKENFYQNRR